MVKYLLVLFLVTTNIYANSKQVNKTETLFETIQKSFSEHTSSQQTLGRYAYSLSLGLASIDTKGATKGGFLGAQLGIRMWKNLWAEGAFYQKMINDFPAMGLDTKVDTFIAKLKYSIDFTSYFHIQPYISYMKVSANSPSAGIVDGGLIGTITDAELLKELNDVAKINTSKIALGATLMLSLGRFISRIDLGSDAFAISTGLLF